LTRFDARAWAEVEEAAQWYEDRAPGYGDRLFDVVETAAQRVGRSPRAGARFEHRRVKREIRRVLLDGFPYSLYYTVEPEIVFVAFAHVARKPGYWIRRLKDV
jgi:toxin ParE1/3/4